MDKVLYNVMYMFLTRLWLGENPKSGNAGYWTAVGFPIWQGPMATMTVALNRN